MIFKLAEQPFYQPLIQFMNTGNGFLCFREIIFPAILNQIGRRVF